MGVPWHDVIVTCWEKSYSVFTLHPVIFTPQVDIFHWLWLDNIQYLSPIHLSIHLWNLHCRTTIMAASMCREYCWFVNFKISQVRSTIIALYAYVYIAVIWWSESSKQIVYICNRACRGTQRCIVWIWFTYHLQCVWRLLLTCSTNSIWWRSVWVG